MRKVVFVFMLALLILTGCKDKKVNKKQSKINFVGADFTFGVYGGATDNGKTHVKLIKRIANYKLDLLFNVGSVVEHFNSEEEWDKFFNILTPVSSLISRYYVVPGKNDDINILKNRFGSIYKIVKPDGYYSFVYKNSLFVILNSNLEKRKIFNQQWFIIETMKKFVKTKNGPIFVFMNTPIYSSGPSGVDQFLKRNWLMFLEHFRTNIIFSSHDKIYGRYKTSVATSTVCLVSGGGGENLDQCNNESNEEFEQYVCKSTPHFIYVGIKNNVIGVNIIDINGKIIDKFVLKVLDRRHTRKGIRGVYRSF